MASAKLFLAVAILATFSLTVNAGFLDYVFPTVMSEFYSLAPTKEGYRFNLEEPNGSKREEIGVIMNPGTKDEQLVVMGSYTVYDEKTDTETITMYTADKDGYKPRYMIKNRKLSPGALKSAAG
ncbi:endocuticle structural glycoprotein SgAbd-9-like [Bactrocera neohumeralis]|uniref:endocuticle structural glycoprotein SgAbd-9-like n=1 Tax=Bactrocera neohumeralis TaxID=98809 RepID=UPI00216619D6|nr:endocuticle structural glycoprotein SgAbd-9-like [Bactrocera neohumeralis]